MAKPGSSNRCPSKNYETEAPFGLRCNLERGHDDEKQHELPDRRQHQAKRGTETVRWS